jgi:hypothetical protein
MLLNSFNSKINLPAIVSKLGIPTSDYDFIRVPLFGWYARSKTNAFIGNIFDFFPIEEWPKLYGRVCRDFSDCFDFKLPYSEHAEKNLFKNQSKIMQYQSLWLLCKQEARTVRARHFDKVMPFKEMLNDLGMPHLITNEIGYMTERVMREFPGLNLDKKFKYKKTIVMPTFCSPKHICSLECMRLSDLNEREALFLNGEYGWYGKHGIEIVRDINELKIKPGNTWNYKVDYWNDRPVNISEMLSTEQLVKIWSEAEKTSFNQDLLQTVIGKEGSEDLRNHVPMLNHNQVLTLEKLTKQSLMPFWMKTREQQFTVHGKTYIKRDKAYYLLTGEGEEQLTNFTLDIHEISKRIDETGKDHFVWCGTIYFENHVVPFEMDDKYFMSGYLFNKGIRHQFFVLGLGIPFINEKYIKQLITMIQLTCYNVHIAPNAAAD